MFKNLIDKLFTSKAKDIKENNIKSSKIASIKVEANNDGTINIVCDWPDFSEKNQKNIQGMAKFFALAIDAINSGILEQEIISTLNNHDKNNPYDILFVHNTLVELIYLAKSKEKTLNSPIISPLDVFAHQD